MRGIISTLARYKIHRRLFKNEDPRKILEQIKEKFKQTKNEWNTEENREKANKYIIGTAIYLAACIAIYEIKKQREIFITPEEVLEAIRHSQTRQIFVVKQQQPKPQQEESNQKEEVPPQPRDNFRKIYLKIEGVSYVSYVPEIQLFYQKINQIQKNKMVSKIKIMEQDFTPIDLQVKRFFSTINKIILPLLFPILLFNSSVGKIFKSKVLGQTEAFRPNIKFKDVAGLGNAKIEISELVDFLKNPAKYKKIGAKVPKGALLSGPPGTGKTMLAKACAGEANVPFFSVSGSQFVQLFAGMGAVRVRDLFKNAKKQTPAIIFIDQIDAIGRKRDDKFGGAHDERANTLNQLLVEMDGFGTADDIIILAATNRKQMLDNALTRPGRFDRMVEIQLPDIKGRQEILQIYLKQIKLSPKQTLQDYSKRLATLTYGFSGADIANLCNQAAILAVRNGSQYVDPKHFQLASERVLAGLQQNLNLQEVEKKKIAFHESGHAVVAWFSQGASPLLKITIIPRSKGSLGFAQYLPNESTLQNKKQLIDQMCVILGGRMSQQMFFKECSSGASDDLQKVRNLARAMVLKYGMSEAFVNYAPIDSDGDNVYSEQTNAKLDKEIMKVIQQCTALTQRTVRLYKDKIQSLATEVLKKETLNHQQIKEILGPRPFEPKQNYKQFLTHSSETITRTDMTI